MAASGWGTREEESFGCAALSGESECQEELEGKTGSERKDVEKMTEVKEGDKGMFDSLRSRAHW